MADTFDSRLKLRLQESGGNSGQWGDLLNQTITNVASVFGFGTHQLTADSDATLTLADDGASLDALKSSYLKITSSVSLTATRTLTFSPNTFNQVKYVENNTTGGQSITISQGSGANVTIATGKTAVVYFDGAGSGAAVVDALAGVDPGVTDTLTEVLAAGNATGGTDIAVGTGDDITFADNSKAIFGAGSDLQIFHDGTHSNIKESGAGDLQIFGDNVNIYNAAGSQNLINLTSGGANTLFHAGSAKLATTSTGIDVTGTIVGDGLTVSPSGTQQVLATLRANSGAGGGLVVQTDASDDGLIRGYDSSGNVQLQFDTDGGDNYIAQGNLGIGDTPAFGSGSGLEVSRSGTATIRVERTGSTASSGEFFAGNGKVVLSSVSNNHLEFRANNTEVMRISGGNLLVGTTTADGGYDESDGGASTVFMGASIGGAASGSAFVSRRAAPLQLNRQANDGDIAVFRKNGTTVGSIGSRSSVVSFIVLDPRTGVKGAALVGGSVDANTGIINPGKADGDIADAAISLGTASSRFKDLHLSGTANTGLLEVASANTTLANFQANVGGAGGVGVVNIKTSTSASNGLQLVGNGSGAAIAGGSLAATVMNTENGPLRFGTNATEKVRIDSAGAFLIGTSASIGTSPAKLEVLGGSGGGRCINTKTAITTSANAITFNNGNGQVGSIATSGSATAYNTSSDYRLKENITDLTSATDRLKQLAPKRFNFKVDPDTTVDGFIAHEVSSIVPEAITGEKDEVDDEGNPVYQGIDQSKLVPLLVATIQELEARIAALESE